MERGFVPGPPGEMAYRRFLPADAPVGRLLVLHGMSEYGRRYEPLGAALAAAGWEVWIHDHRGHGDSPGPRGHVRDFRDYVKDARAVHAWVAERHPWEGPLFLMGHSMGGLLAPLYLLDHPAGFAGLVLSAPLLGLRAQVPIWKRAAAFLFSRLTPSLAVHTGFDAQLLSHDRTRVADYLGDPKIHRRASMLWYRRMIAAMAEANARAEEITLPVLVLHGADDHLTCPAASRRFHDRLGSRDRTYLLLEGLYHELLQETSREEIYGRIAGWMGARCASSAAS